MTTVIEFGVCDKLKKKKESNIAKLEIPFL